MLKKIIFSVFASTCLFTAAHAEVKTSSLSMAKPVVNAKLPAQCQKMFNIADNLVRDAERQPGTHTQVAKMKNKLSSTKKQILAMEAELQQKSCEKGLTTLNTLKQKH